MANNSTFTLNIKALFDASDIKAKVGDIEKAFNNIKLSDGLKRNLTSSFNDLNKALDTFQAKAQKGITSKADTKGLNTSLNSVISGFQKLEHVVDKVRAEVGDSVDLSKIIKLDDNTANKLKGLQADIKNLKDQLNNINTSKIDSLNDALNKIKNTTKAFSHGQEAIDLFKKGDIQEAITLLDKVIAKQETMRNAAKNAAAVNTYDNNIAQLNELRNIMNQAQSDTSNVTSQINQKMREVGDTSSKAFNDLVTGINNGSKSLAQFRQNAENVAAPLNNAATNQLRLNTELDQLKSRIQYFIGLSNAVNLFKRGVQSAFNTVKELDKAMTETAVVTDFTVADMWAQLPDYTKRANELGVTTKAAYEAATLYYQQGLKTNEVTAMSNETLKMARIAGLDAAVATDRMTNAIRGFNMEINEMNAQRIDDVYSKLAAISASNVDEISTAMTKVASLANNANMEFETTSAFLAQIIETTRESAETAGTALKTVVARFSEVKKLVSEDQLKGQDEEGQLIDVNKVSEALRTAGVDLNKYFLGEVGLDDIFMELASKWDSLTTLQQRYIATQAAGSRQQSRFIALMSDYGRMQELVGEAYNANGAAAEQFGKTQDSLQSKLARLKNAWDEFAMGITNNSVIKGAVSLLTLLLNIVNKVTGAFGEGIGSVLKFGAAIGTLAGVKKLFKAGGLAEKGLAAFGNSKVGQFFGLGGNETAVAGASFKAQVVSAGAEFAAAVRGAAATNAAGTAGAGAGRTGAGIAGAAGTGSLSGWLKNFKRKNVDPRPLAQYQALSPAEKIRVASTTGVPVGAAPKTLFGALGNKFYSTSLGGVARSGLAKLGVAGGSTAAVSGAAALAATIGTITTAAGVAYIAIKKLYDASPTGQVKIAEKYADTIRKVSEEAKKTQNSLKDAQTKYKEYSQAISDSTNVQDHSKAIQDRNEYLTSLLEQDASFADFIQSDIKNGEFVLTINEDAFANAIAKAEEAVQESKVNDLLAQANLSAQKADLAATMAAASRDILYNENGDIISSKDTTVSLRYKSQQQASTFQAQSFAQQAALAMLGDTNLGDELTKTLANSYATAFDADKYQKEAGNRNWFARTLDHAGIKRDYEAIYGLGSSKDLTYKEMDQAVQASKAAEGEQAKIDELINYLKQDDGKKYESVLKAYSGDFSEFSSLISEGKLNLDLDPEALNNVADTFGISVEELSEQIQNYAQTERERQLQTRDTGYYSLAKGGASKLDIAQYLTLDNFEDMELISGLAQKFESSGVGGEIAHSILDQIENGTFEDSTLQKWLQDLNFDNPIAGAKALHDGLQSVNPQVRELAEAIQADDEAMSQFSASAQLSYLMTSESAEQLNESLGDFIEENGAINSSNIRELAASSADLNTLLETGAFTAKGLAVALNGISSGAFNFYDLNDAIIAAFNSMDDLDGIVSGTIEDLNSFDPGYDENDITGFISKAYENATENFNKGAYGNNQMANYMREIFGAFNPTEGQDYGEGYKAWLQDSISWLEANKENMYSAWSDVAASWQNGQQGLADIIDTGSEIIIELNGQNTQELIKSLQENTNLTDTQIRMLIADYKNYSADFAHELAVNDASKAIDTFMAENRKHIGDQALYTEQELDTLAKGLGLSLEEVRKQIFEKSGGLKSGKVQILDIDAKDINSVKAALKKVSNVVGEYATSDGLINAINLKKGMGILGIDEEFEATLNQMVGDAKTFKWDFGDGNGLVDVAIAEGQTAGEALASAMEAKAQEQFGANFFSGIVAAAAENKIDIEAIDIPLSIKADDVETELSTVIEKQKTINSTKATASVYVSGASNAKQQIDSLQAALNKLKGTRSTTISITASGAGGLIVDKPGGGKRPHGEGGNTQVAKAKGGRALPGVALTGEEGPEVVWNKEQGYAYITGKNGPEYQNLQPGDRVFNAQETKKILKNSKKNGITKSFATGYEGTTKSGVGTGSSSKTSAKTTTNSEKTSDEWKNELDWLYNLMEDIAESERTQEKLATKHERYLKDATKTGKDLYNITKQQMQNLNQQYAYQKQALSGREKEMQEQINQSGYTDYVWWNNNDRTIEINWDKIENLQDKDTYDKVSELVSKAEDIQSKIDAAEDALRDIEGQMGELQERYIQEYIDFEQTVLQAVVGKYQETIDELSSLDDTLNKANNDILNSIRKEIDLQRQIRDNTDTENNINDMETRLAYLRRNTTGANQNEILQLEKQIREARQGYSDTLVDQSLDKLSEANEEASEQRQHQIQLLTEQLEYWQNSGALWTEVQGLMQESLDKGYLVVDSKLVDLIKLTEEYQKMSPVQQAKFIKDLEISFKDVIAFYQNQQHPNYNPSTNYMDDILKLVAQRGSDVWDSEEFNDLLKNRNEKYIAEGWGTEEDLANEMAALHKLTDTPWAPYQKVNFDPNTDYMAIMNALLEKYGSGAVNTKEWKDAAAARESKMAEESKAKGEDVEAAIAKARFQQAILENKASKLEDYSQIKWDDNIDYKAEMLKIIEELGVNALTDPTYLKYAAAREQKIVEKGLGTREQAQAEQAEINDLAIQAGTEAEINELMQEILDSIYKGIGNTPIFNKNGGYATGGLTSKTGLAWLDGTPSEPEYVLNARQTDAFLRLAEVLPSALGRGSSLTNTIGGNVYLELTMNVGEIGSDYDVDRLVDRVKQDIYDASAYRNINVISSIR